MAATVNSDIKLEFVLSSGNKIQLIPNIAGFFTVNFILADGTIIDTDAVDQATAIKFQLELQDFNNARLAQLR